MNVPEGNGAADAAVATVLRVLARRAVGLSGADIERLVREARQTARRERRVLLWSDLDGRLTASKPVKPEDLRWRTALHEAGHAVARLVLGLGTITLITIDGPGGGGMVQSEEQEPVAETEDWISSLLIVKLAGRAAEEIVLGTCIAGSGGSPDSDLAGATALALQMEVAFGFGTKMPLLYRNAEAHGAILLSRPEVARRVNDRLEKAYEAARELIRDHLAPLQSLGHELLQHDTLEGEHLVQVFACVFGPVMHEGGGRKHPEERLTEAVGTKNLPS